MASSANMCNPWKVASTEAAVQQACVSEDQPLIMVWNLSEFKRALAEEREALPGNHWVHTVAAKANPLRAIFEVARDEGAGAECASLGELSQALASGFEPEKIVFDSPTKTRKEIKLALERGVGINMDNFQELKRFDELVPLIPAPEGVKRSLGIRVNTEVGAGSIATHSTSCSWSKFGVGIEEYREDLLGAYAERPWLNMIHCHVGSQGCPLELIIRGIRKTVDLALEINKRAGKKQVETIDIGGGLPTNFADEKNLPTFKEWAEMLKASVPELFSGEYRVITENGRRYLAKAGWLVSYVEYTKKAGGRHIALQHAGVDIAIRTIYHPDKWPLRLTVFDSAGKPRDESELIEQDVAGPCCIAGDIIAHLRPLPLIHQGDFILMHDVGAYYHSSWSYYNSRQAPALYGFEEGEGEIKFRLLRKAESVEDTIRFFT